MKKVKAIFLVGIVAIMMIGTFGLTGCLYKEHKVHEDGYFQYIIVGENSTFPKRKEKGIVAIIGFTESGKEQEVIDFPKVIDGKPVQYIGYRKNNTFMNSYYHLESPNLKKLYVHENIESVYKGAFLYGRLDNKKLDIMVCGVNSPYIVFEEYHFDKFYVYESVFNADSFNQNVCKANVIYLNNYSSEVNGGYYRLDNIESGEKVPIPPIPNRDGYEFAGWYTESECVNAWDFEIAPTIADDTAFKLYAKWQQK